MSNSDNFADSNPGCAIFLGWLLVGVAMVCVGGGLGAMGYKRFERGHFDRVNDPVAVVAIGALGLLFGGPGAFFIYMGKKARKSARAQVGALGVLAATLAAAQAAHRCAKCGGPFKWPESFKSGLIQMPAHYIDKPIYCPKCDRCYCIQCVQGQCPVCGGRDYKPVG